MFDGWVTVAVVDMIVVYEAYDHLEEIYRPWRDICKTCTKAEITTETACTLYRVKEVTGTRPSRGPVLMEPMPR